MVRESGWNTVKLKDICDFIGGDTRSRVLVWKYTLDFVIGPNRKLHMGN